MQNIHLIPTMNMLLRKAFSQLFLVNTQKFPALWHCSALRESYQKSWTRTIQQLPLMISHFSRF